MNIELSTARRAMLDALQISAREQHEGGLTLEQAMVDAQRIADADQVEMVVGWQINDDSGAREAGFCPRAAIEILVIEPVELVTPYRGGRADYAERQEHRRDRLDAAATKAREESEARYLQSRAAVENIPFGQPILVGHHSESRHRNAIKRSTSHMDACVTAGAKARELAARADAVGNAGVSSDDPEAVVKLRAQLVELEASQATMKKCNAIIRKNGGNAAGCLLTLQAEGLTESQAAELLAPRFSRKPGFASYALTNNNANIRRVKGRIAELLAVATKPEGERMRSKSGVVYRVGSNRVQLVFKGKPADEIRARLKQYGFRWAPSEGAWQRHLNAAGENTATAIIQWLDQEGL